MRLPLFRPHSRYFEMADAFADGELSDRERSRFESHLATCGACAATVEAARETKRLLRALPEHSAPRSFRLTPAMARQTRPGRAEAWPSWAPTLVLRASQATAGLAAAALAIVLIGNLSLSTSGDDDDAGAFQASEKAGETSFSGAATAAATSAAGARDAGSATAAASGTVPPAPRTGGDGQAAPSVNDTLGSATPGPDGRPGGALEHSLTGADDADLPGVVVTGADRFALDAPARVRDRGGSFPTIEVVLAGVLLAAVAAAVAASRHRKESS